MTAAAASRSGHDTYTAIVDSIRKAVLGKDTVIRLALTTLLAEGHLLIEDLPGLGKTTLALAIARGVGGTASRIQFTPDLLPSDITGSTVHHEGEWTFRPGGVFANVVLADEINRGTPKTQSALLEAMAERQVTVESRSRPLPTPFFVVGTQNPIEMEGTYRLPEAQVDRFLMRIEMAAPSLADERRIVLADAARPTGSLADAVERAVDLRGLERLIAEVRTVTVKPELLDYAIGLAAATRTHRWVRYGASPRGSIALVRAARAWAFTANRPYVTLDDLKDLAQPVLAHRLVLNPNAELEGRRPNDIVAELLASSFPNTAVRA